MSKPIPHDYSKRVKHRDTLAYIFIVCLTLLISGCANIDADSTPATSENSAPASPVIVGELASTSISGQTFNVPAVWTKTVIPGSANGFRTESNCEVAVTRIGKPVELTEQFVQDVGKSLNGSVNNVSVSPDDASFTLNAGTHQAFVRIISLKSGVFLWVTKNVNNCAFESESDIVRNLSLG